MTDRSARKGSDRLRIYEGWFGEIEQKATETRSDADGDMRRLAMTAFILAVILAPTERRTT